MVVVPFCQECGEEMCDPIDIEAGMCIDCQQDAESSSFYESEDE